jgi:uncharacterized phage protein (TIGR02216 family)
LRAAADPVAAFPWDEVMAVGLGVLRLAPGEFWRMTPKEFGQAIAPMTAAPVAPIGRAGLAALMRRFPDG